MTVAELIETLQGFAPDDLVYIYAGDGLDDLKEVKALRVHRDVLTVSYSGPHSHTDREGLLYGDFAVKPDPASAVPGIVVG